jgi:hypothetical protein
VHAKHRLHRELVEQAVLDHFARAATALFGGLKNQVDRAVKVALGCQMLRRRQQHGGVAIVAAGVHLAGMLAGVGKGVELLHGQRIHVGAQANGPVDVPALTMPTTPVVPIPRCTGMPHCVNWAPPGRPCGRSSKHNSGCAWMSRRMDAMLGAAETQVVNQIHTGVTK